MLDQVSGLTEEARLNALRDLDLLDTPISESFDRITRLASQFFQMPVAAVSLTDHNRQWFKSSVGVDVREIPRAKAPCATVSATNGTLVVPDMTEDPRFDGGTIVQAGYRFYAGAPLITRDGHTIGAMCVLDSAPRLLPPGGLSMLCDLAKLVMAQIELQRDFGRVDLLSGLPNRTQLIEDLEDRARTRPGLRGAIVLADLCDTGNFERAASVLGIDIVDELVRVASRAIRQVLGRRRGIYQVSTSAYAIVLEDAAGDAWQDLAEALAARFREPLVCNDIPVVLGAAFGIAPFALDRVAPADALRAAISAAQEAREAGMAHAVYDQASDAANRRRFDLLTDFRTALCQPGQLRLVYQPRITLAGRCCASAEALLRWDHPVLGPVSPGEFIPLIEQTTLARPLTAWVIEAALAQIAAWQQAGLALRVSVNVSAVNLEDADFAAGLAAGLRRHGVAPGAIELEVTESALIRNGSQVFAQLAAIRAMGVEIAIDDFGTGYSTFSYLKQIPASIVKLDQSFMVGLAGSPRDQRLVGSMIALAHDLDYRVVAEGVETAEVEAILAALGCDEVQGYLHCRPIPPAMLVEWVARR